MLSFRVLLVTVSAAAFAAPAWSGAWVYQDSSQQLVNAGTCPDVCCEDEAEQSGSMDSGRATFSSTLHPPRGPNYCDRFSRTNSYFAWQVPPTLLAPDQNLVVNAAVRNDDSNNPYGGNEVVSAISLMIVWQKEQIHPGIGHGVLSFSPSGTGAKEAFATLTAPVPAGEANQELYVKVVVSGIGDVGGDYWYRYAYDANAEAPISNIATGEPAIATPDASSSDAATPGSDLATGEPTITTPGVSSSDAATPDPDPAAEGAPASVPDAIAGSGISVSSSAMEGLGEAGPVLGATTAAAILVSVLVSFGALLTGGLSGVAPGAISSSIADLLKGRLPSGGFLDWQRQAGRIYGSGTPEDPFRDYPDARNPPWKAPYGDGSVANPYSDTAPPVIDRSPVPPNRTFTTVVDAKPLMGAGGREYAHPAPTTPTAKSPLADPPLKKTEPVAEIPVIPNPGAQALGQLASIAGELEKAAGQLKAEGKYIANGDMIDKVRYGVPQSGKWAAEWVAGILRDAGVLDAKRPPPQIADPNWGTCEQARDWGEGKLARKVKEIFGPDAIFTTVMVKSNYNPLGNHIANEVIMANGERYVVDMWATMVEGKAKILPEADWVKKWKAEPQIGSSVTVVRGGGTSVYETILADNIRKYGIDQGIAETRKTLHRSPGKVDTVIKSYNRQPWSLANGEPLHQQDAVISEGGPQSAPQPPEAGPEKNLQY